MSIERARMYLKEYGLDQEIIEFSVSSATVEEAAKAINGMEEEIAKTLSFLVDGNPILIVVSGDSKIDNSKYKGEFHATAKMIPYDEVEERIGHAVGGVCPFGVKKDVTIYLDQSLKKCEAVYPACGSSNSAIKLTIEQMEKITQFEKWIDVCKN